MLTGPGTANGRVSKRKAWLERECPEGLMGQVEIRGRRD